MFRNKDTGEMAGPDLIFNIILAIIDIPVILLINYALFRKITPAMVFGALVCAFGVFLITTHLPTGLVYFAVIAVITFIIYVCITHINKEKAEIQPESEPVYYLDGVEIDGDKIDLDLYSYSYDEDANIYYLTHK